MLKFNKAKLDENWISYGIFKKLYGGKKIKFYEPNLKEKNERVMIMISGEFQFNNPSIIFCSYPLSAIIRKKLNTGISKKEVLSSIIYHEILGRKDDPEMYLLCNTEESFEIDDLNNSKVDFSDLIAF